MIDSAPKVQSQAKFCCCHARVFETVCCAEPCHKPDDWYAALHDVQTCTSELGGLSFDMQMLSHLHRSGFCTLTCVMRTQSCSTRFCMMSTSSDSPTQEP